MTGGLLEERLRRWAGERGYAIAFAAPGVVDEVKRKLLERRDQGLLDAAFFEEYLKGFRFLEGVPAPRPARIVMVAVPSPIHVLRLFAGGQRVEALIPPTYVRYNATFADVLSDMKANALGPGAEAEALKAPLKSLAVHMGLTTYGRNNITYAPGLGSGFQLCGYIVATGEQLGGTGAGLGGRETFLDRCTHCRACVRACPTGAIREDRFLIRAERCFTLLSESRRPIPAWARPPKRLCLIGCMACQLVCPENKGRLRTAASIVEFTAEETAAVLAAGRRVVWTGEHRAVEGPDVSMAAAWASASAKFAPLGMTEDLDIMGRNVGFYLEPR